MLITAAAAGAIQLCGTARWSRALSRADSNHESALFVVGGGGGGGGEPNNRFLQVVCVVVCLVGPRFGSPSSSLPLGEDEEKKLHGIVGWPPACCGKLAVAVGRCAENTELEAHSAQLGGLSMTVHGSPPPANLKFGVSGWGGFNSGFRL